MSSPDEAVDGSDDGAEDPIDGADSPADEPADLSDEDVIAAAEALGAELAATQEESTPFQFTSILMQCNQAISDETGIDYGNACGAGGSC